MIEHMLTTIDNPYDPFTSFDEWDAWDQSHGYYTTSYLARIVRTSDELPESQQILAIEQGIDEIIKESILDVYKKVSLDSKQDDSGP